MTLWSSQKESEATRVVKNDEIEVEVCVGR